MTDNRFASSETLAKQLADSLAKRIREAIEARGRVCIAVSGGSTPVRFFQELSKRELDWSKVLITLVDERWVDETDPASNARLVREHLLQNHAAKAYFLRHLHSDSWRVLLNAETSSRYVRHYPCPKPRNPVG